jgi:hypothetical protein
MALTSSRLSSRKCADVGDLLLLRLDDGVRYMRRPSRPEQSFNLFSELLYQVCLLDALLIGDVESNPSPFPQTLVRGAVVTAVGKDRESSCLLSLPADNGVAAHRMSIDPKSEVSTVRPIFDTAATWKFDLASRRWMISPYGSEEVQEDRGIILFTPLVSQ